MSSENGAIETRSKTPWLSIVGIGLGGWPELGAPARQALVDAELIVGGERHLAMLPGEVVGARTAWPQPFTAGLSMILAYRGHPVVVLATGDPFWFGAGASLSRLVTATHHAKSVPTNDARPPREAGT